MRDLVVGIDVGGTVVKVGLVAPQGRVVAETAFPARWAATAPSLLRAVEGAVRQLTDARAGRVRLRGLGIGVPGLVDVSRGFVHACVNLPRLKRVPLKVLLQRRWRVPVAVDNDVNLMALGESRFGAGRGAQDLVCVTLGTGVGGGLVVHGRLYHGSRGAAGEIGHMTIDKAGPRCQCGNRGCLEAFIGTRAIVARAKTALRRRADAATPEAVSRAARRGEAAARQLWQEIGEDLGAALAGVVNLLNPSRIVIGGGVAQAGSLLFPSVRQTIRERAMTVPGRSVRVVPAALGSRAGLIGAAAAAWDLVKETGRGTGDREVVE